MPYELGSGEGKRKREEGEGKGERERVKKEPEEEERENLVNHTGGFNLRPTHSLKRAGRRKSDPTLCLLLLLLRALSDADRQADPFNATHSAHDTAVIREGEK